MIRLDIEEYCHGCPHFDPRKDATFTRDSDGVVVAVDNSVFCYNSVRCESIAKYLRKKIAEETKKMVEFKSFSEFLDGREANDDTRQEYFKYLQGNFHEFKDRINAEQIKLTPYQMEAMNAISNFFDDIVKEKENE